MTNIDMIRNLDANELAHFIALVATDRMGLDTFDESDCSLEEALVEWLNAETLVEEG